MRARPSRATLALAAGVALLAPAAAAATAGDEPEETERAGPAIGLLLGQDLSGGAGSLVVRIVAVRGLSDWSGIEEAISRLAAAGARVVLALDDDAGDGTREESLEPWIDFVRDATRRFGGRVEAFEIGAEPGAGGSDPDRAALRLKQSALALRAVASAAGVPVRVVAAPVSGEDLSWMRALWERDVAAYVDVLPLWIDAAQGPAAAANAVRAAYAESLAHPPALEIWTYSRRSAPGDGPALAVASLAAGASVAAFEGSGGDDAAETLWAAGFARLLADGFGPAPEGRARIVDASGAAAPGARVLGTFFRERDFTTMLVTDARGAEGGGSWLVVEADRVRDVRWIDFASGQARRVAVGPTPDGSPGLALALDPARTPQLLLYERQTAAAGLDLPPEDVRIESSRGLTAEEIISRHQQVQQEQDDRLERWTARGRIDFHFRLTQGGTGFDVSIDTNYFWERGGELEWEQTDYYINGNAVGWKNVPELPLIQPERVITLPLDLTLNRTYSYRLAGEERVGDRPAYVLEFQPAAPQSALNLYRGRVWIDRERFVRLKTALIQSDLDPPVLSNEELDRFAAQVGPDGASYWMFDRIDGQQVWNTAGRTFVVRREVTFLEYRINPPAEEFGARRAAAYASKNQMLRETEHGFRYLERREDGTRAVKERIDTSQLFAAAGAFKDNSQDSVVPLAGVNYFDYDLGRHGIQLNALFAGVFAFVTASKPDLFGIGADLTGDATLSALYGDDRVFVADEEVEALRIETRSQGLALRLGLPAGKFVKFNLIGRLGFNEYRQDDEATAALDEAGDELGLALEFVLPPDHSEVGGEIEAVFNRRGYTLTATGGVARRSEWEEWGVRNTATEQFGAFDAGGFLPGEEPSLEDRYARWGVGLFKEWYLRAFQKVRAELQWLDGSGLDRFSRYGFSFFGDDRLNGFSGSGVRFDEGAIARAGYSFNLLEAVRFDVALDSALVEEAGSPAGRQSFSGVGLSANFVAPWKSIVNINYGYALDSDIPELEGSQEFLLFWFKLF